MTTTTTRARSPFYMAITATSGVELQLIPGPISAIKAELGLTEMVSGEAPEGKTLIGSGKADALEAGCFAVNLIYKVGLKTQTAKVLVSPTKAAPGLFASLRGKQYNAKNIVKVRVPRRRVYLM